MIDIPGLMQRAFAAYQRDDRGEAERLCRAVIGAEEDHFEAHHLLAVVQTRLGAEREALASYDRALAIRPDDLQALSNRSVALDELGRHDEALAGFAKALSIRPDYPPALSNRGNTLRALKRFAEARASYDKALALAPDFADCRFNRALLLLLLGRFAEGWREYEWRRQIKTWIAQTFDAPEWQGDDPRGKRLLLYAEQGLGDTIQFARFARVLAERGAEVMVRVQRPLAGLMRTADGVAAVLPEGDEPPHIDSHLPLLSVPFVLGLDETQIPADVPYLRADPARVEAWAKRLPEGAFPKGLFRVGIAWQGNPRRKIDQGRSIPLAAFAPLGDIPGVRLISLQKHDGVEQLADLPPGMEITSLGEDFDAGPDGFLDSAAVMMHLDLVVTSDSTMAHLAGALGRPVWILLQEVPDWRWMMGRADSPWYPTARLFRQRRRDDWDEVLARAAGELATIVDEKTHQAAAPVMHTPSATTADPLNLPGAIELALRAYERGELGDAERRCRAVIEAERDNFDAHHLLAVIHARHGRHGPALASYDRALAIRPDDPQALSNRGVTLDELARYDEALAGFDKALALRPDYPPALSNRGNALRALKRFAEALASYDKALALRPDFAEALSNRGTALHEMRRYAEALASYDKALALRPDDAHALSNRGLALQELKRPAEALASFDKALWLRPDYPDCHCNRALVLLLLGRFSEGWREYEWRRKTRAWVPRSFAAPEWRGENPQGKRLLLYAEQGLGDTIQFARFAGVLAERGAEVIVEVHPPLGGLMQTLDGARQVVRQGEKLPEIDGHLALLSVPFVLGLDETQIPAAVPYLRADPARVEAWAKRLPKGLLHEGEFRIGIAWQGNPKADIDRGRSIPLSAFAPLSQIPGVRLISLQKYDGVEQLTDLPPGMEITSLGEDFDAGPDGFLDSAAVMMHLDLIIASDSTIAHLAGALGRPVWLVLKEVPEWRWMMGRADSPWYPTALLFRQSRRDDWDEVFARVAGALARLVAGKANPADWRPDAIAAENARLTAAVSQADDGETMPAYGTSLARRPDRRERFDATTDPPQPLVGPALLGSEAPAAASPRPKTIVFCTSFCASRNGWDNRYRRWLEAIQASALIVDQVLIVDDGSATLPQWADLQIIKESGQLAPEKPLALFHFADHLGRRSVFDFPGWYRSFAFAAVFAMANGFEKIIHVESDAFLISRRIIDYINAVNDGWIAFWCKRWNFPETAIQVITGSAMASFCAVAKRPNSDFINEGFEKLLPFTHIEKSFEGDRYGEYTDRVPHFADFATQTADSAPDGYYWWLAKDVPALDEAMKRAERYAFLYRDGKHLEMHRGDPEQIIATYLRAADLAPHRAEALHAASTFCNATGRNEQGYRIAKRGIDLPQPGSELGVEPWIYQYGLLTIFLVNAFGAGHYEETLQACECLLGEREVPEPLREPVKMYARSAREKLTASSPQSPSAEPVVRQEVAGDGDLIRLAEKYGVDKWGEHWYMQHYERHFQSLRYAKINILEIGVGGYQYPNRGGESLRMWEEYFPKAIIYGIDIHDKKAHERDRIRIRQGSQDDPKFLKEVVDDAHGFDIIIDDGSHINEHMIKSFLTLFPLLNDGGFYAVEDLQTSYWPRFGGSSKDLNRDQSAVGFFKNLVDCLNYEEIIRPGYQPTYFDRHIREIYFYHNLIIIKKGSNREGSNHLKDNVPIDALPG